MRKGKNSSKGELRIRKKEDLRVLEKKKEKFSITGGGGGVIHVERGGVFYLRQGEKKAVRGGRGESEKVFLS